MNTQWQYCVVLKPCDKVDRQGSTVSGSTGQMLKLCNVFYDLGFLFHLSAKQNWFISRCSGIQGWVNIANEILCIVTRHSRLQLHWINTSLMKNKGSSACRELPATAPFSNRRTAGIFLFVSGLSLFFFSLGSQSDNEFIKKWSMILAKWFTQSIQLVLLI